MPGAPPVAVFKGWEPRTSAPELIHSCPKMASSRSKLRRPNARATHQRDPFNALRLCHYLLRAGCWDLACTGASVHSSQTSRVPLCKCDSREIPRSAGENAELRDDATPKWERPVREPKRFWVYIMTNRSRSHVLYTGVTGKLTRRVFQHKNKLVPGFTSRYNLTRLVYYESFVYPDAAIAREKEIKAWRRSKKIRLIESTNPHWYDLAESWADVYRPPGSGQRAL